MIHKRELEFLRELSGEILWQRHLMERDKTYRYWEKLNEELTEDLCRKIECLYFNIQSRRALKIKTEMVITYVVRKLEDGFSGSYISQEHGFKTLGEAITFHQSQPRGEYSHWEILVSYT